ncbi:hypothetical protein [Brevibacillus brevis]|uniref:hypothetical protein n=1 Tax=Brevibacillus brevis TaxID=1393 RepID=UPI0037CC6691
MIQWIEYDPKNPPKVNEEYIVSDGRYVDVARICDYFDELRWYPPDRSQIEELFITHYAEINLPDVEPCEVCGKMVAVDRKYKIVTCEDESCILRVQRSLGGEGT